MVEKVVVIRCCDVENIARHDDDDEETVELVKGKRAATVNKLREGAVISRARSRGREAAAMVHFIECLCLCWCWGSWRA
jgi:hypothetical protein